MIAEFSAQIAPMFDLTGKVALVTGGAVGMGKGTGLAYAAAGATVILVDEPERVAALAELPAGVSAMACDITSEDSIRTAVAGVIAAQGGIDLLVNGAVINHNKPILETTAEEWDQVQAVNLRGAFIATREVVPSMQKRGGGRIINISTMGSVHPVLHGNGAYSSSRAGLNQFTRNCALDFAKDGITANAILAGAIITETIPSGARPTGPGADGARHLFGYGKVDDMTGLALLLASPAGRFITGQLIAVDGGFMIS
jgi:NAD(P)-dependent dehydrogenase (short-subunit alcohol dehydrogenase family)